MPGKFETIPFVPILKASPLYQIVNNGDFNDEASIFLPCRPTYHPNSIRPSAKQPERWDLTASWNTPSAPYRVASAKGEATKAVPFWLDKASIGG